MQDANIFGGLLLILHNIGCSKVDMFSIDDALSMSLPHRPPCLYSVATSHHHLELNMAPWLYIRATSQHNFSLHQLPDQSRVAGGDFPLQGGGAEEVEHQLEFCPDHPSRLMHYGHFGLRVYHMENQGPGTATTFHLEFQCQPPSAEEKTTTIPQSSTVKRRGRQVKKPPNYFEKMSDSVDHVLYDYENELNIFGVLFYKETLDEDTNSQIVHVSHIDLYDSKFKHLRKIPLDILHQRSNMDLSNKISLVMDQDLILITLKNAAKSLLYILRNFDVEDLEKL